MLVDKAILDILPVVIKLAMEQTAVVDVALINYYAVSFHGHRVGMPAAL